MLTSFLDDLVAIIMDFVSFVRMSVLWNGKQSEGFTPLEVSDRVIHFLLTYFFYAWKGWLTLFKMQ